MTNSGFTPDAQGSDNEEEVAISPAFVACLEAEAAQLQKDIENGTSPMQAQAKTLLWLDTLVKMHAVGLDQSLKEENASQCAIWSRDLASLEMALALIQNVRPLDDDNNSST